MKLHVSRFRLESKPKTFDFRAQTFDFYQVVDVNVEEMAKLVSEGRCWRNGNYDLEARSFKKAHIVDSHFLVLDFDAAAHHPNTVSEVLRPNFWYYTMSQGLKEGHNFRMVWVLSRSINKSEHSILYKWFLDKFRDYGPDKNVKDISRMWYGGCGEYEVLTEELFDVEPVLIHAQRSEPAVQTSLPLYKYTPQKVDEN